MSEPPKPADSAAKATDDFVTKYKVRVTSGDANPPRLPRDGKIIDFVVKLSGLPVSPPSVDLLRDV